MIIWVYDRWGNQINCIGDFQDLAFDDELGSLDFIEFTIVGDVLEKGNYLVWRDEFGIWHEHIVRSVDRVHGQGEITQYVYAVNSISELTLSYKSERDSYGLSNAVAFQRLLEDTRWTSGSMENLGNANIKFYHTTVYDGIVAIVDTWGGELSTSITVTASGVTERKINHQKSRGSDDGLTFTYGFDMGNIERKVELDDVYTRLHVFGKGEPSYNSEGTQSGYGRRLTFESVNGGKDYVEDAAAMQTWGVVGKNGVKQHSEGVCIFDKCEDPSELLALGKAKLEEVKVPRITYTADVAILADAGMEFKNARTGDVCYIRDKELDERLNGRIIHTRRYISGSKPTEITLGNLKRTVKDIFQEQSKAIQKLTDSAANWNGVADYNRAWLANMMNTLNESINATGGYAYWEEGEGITVYDKPKNSNPTKCIQLKGGSFRIANSKKSNGEWDFKTFGTGDGFTASLLNVGSIVCGENTINLDSGLVTLKDGTIIANMIFGGTLTLGGESQRNGVLKLLNARNEQIGLLDTNGVSFTQGSISLGSGFKVGSDGAMYARYPKFASGIYLGDSLQSTLPFEQMTWKSAIVYRDLGEMEVPGVGVIHPASLNIGSTSDDTDIRGDDITLAPNRWIILDGTVLDWSSLHTAGTMSSVVMSENYDNAQVYSYEAASPIVEDVGNGETDSDGVCVVYLDENFLETVNTNMEYYVFLQKLGDGDLYIEQKLPSYFIVMGSPNLRFSWEVKCRRIEYEYNRLDLLDVEPVAGIDYEGDYLQQIESENLIREKWYEAA